MDRESQLVNGYPGLETANAISVGPFGLPLSDHFTQTTAITLPLPLPTPIYFFLTEFLFQVVWWVMNQTQFDWDELCEALGEGTISLSPPQRASRLTNPEQERT